jgi:hypothetical protein
MEVEDIQDPVLPQVRLFWRTQPVTLILDLTPSERACASGVGGALAPVAHQTRRVVKDKNDFVASLAGQSRLGILIRTLLQGVTGVVLIALGVRLAFEQKEHVGQVLGLIPSGLWLHASVVTRIQGV